MTRGRRVMRKRLLVPVLMALAAAGPVMAAKDSQPSLWKTKKDLAEKKKEEQRLLAEKRQKTREEQQTLATLEQLDKKRAALRTERKRYKDEIDLTNAQVLAMRRRQRLTAGQVEESRDRLKRFLRAWRQGNPEELSSEVAYWCAYVEAGRLSNARLTKFELGQREDWLAEYLGRQKLLKENLAAKERELAKVRNRRASFLKSVRRETKKQDRLLEEINISKRQLERRVKKILESEQARRAKAAKASKASRVPASAHVGQLVWPVRGKVLRRYGRQKHREFNAIVYSPGIEIAARQGSQIKAAAKGRVVHADWLKGYGRVMIVDHGSGFYTVYGHLQDFLVKEKQEVKRGMAIGTVGNTGYTGEPSLYFEVRVKGRDKNPMHYLSRSAS